MVPCHRSLRGIELQVVYLRHALSGNLVAERDELGLFCWRFLAVVLVRKPIGFLVIAVAVANTLAFRALECCRSLTHHAGTFDGTFDSPVHVVFVDCRHCRHCYDLVGSTRLAIFRVAISKSSTSSVEYINKKLKNEVTTLVYSRVHVINILSYTNVYINMTR
jgi:hypothetical protein